MRGEPVAYRGAVLLLGVALLTGGCLTPEAPPLGRGARGPRAMPAWRATAPTSPPLQTPSAFPSTEPGERERPPQPDGEERLHRRRAARGLGLEVAVVRPDEARPACGGQAVPEGWPDYSTWWEEELLAPFFTCTSPAEFLALQDRVDMPRLVAELGDWNAVRLGALGPVREDSAPLLNLRRTAFLLRAIEEYGPPRAEVFALFILHSSHDDDLREVLFLLARGKHLEETLRLLPGFLSALEERGLKPTARMDREFEWTDVGRGLARAGRDALATSPYVIGGRETSLSSIRGQLPPPYQQALHEVEMALARELFAPGNVALGSFDHLTFGVPLGLHGLMAGTGQGAYSLSQGRYEQATRELAPTALMVALYAGGKGMRSLSSGRPLPAVGVPRPGGPLGMEVRLRALEAVVRELEAHLGVEGLGKLGGYIRASREAGRLVAVEGVDGALALYAAEGEVTRARPLLSQARAQGARGGAGKAPGGLASLVDNAGGLTPEVVEAKLAAAELESTARRLPADPARLERHRPTLAAPLPGAEGNPRWAEYVSYFEHRLAQLATGQTKKGPLPWNAYEQLRTWFARGLRFERAMLELLEADAALPPAQRLFLQDFIQPRIEKYVGVSKPGTGLRFVDVLIIEEGGLPGRPPRVETLSFKSRDLSRLGERELRGQMIADAKEALSKYGETLDIRRPSLQSLLGADSKVPVSRVRLVYEGNILKPRDPRELKAAVDITKEAVPGVEVLFQ